MKKILITGGAGFIGSTLIDLLIRENVWDITNVDNFDPFYPRAYKENNIKNHFSYAHYRFHELDICDYEKLCAELNEEYDVIVHLAAKAGVRPSIDKPLDYENANVRGTASLLEFAKTKNIKQFVFASSSSVYGVNKNVPWIETEQLLPISPYAATKLACEQLGFTYSYLYNIRFLGLRLFTVFGPRQRPDLAIHKFVGNILNGKVINVFGDGETARDYTFVQDIVNGIRAAIDYDKSIYEIINVGNRHPVKLKELIFDLEQVLGKKALINRQDNQMGDVPITYANIDKAGKLLNYSPKTSLFDGLCAFRDWYLTDIIK